MSPLRSLSLAKLALPITRLNIMRPATVTRTGCESNHSAGCPPQARCSSSAVESRRKSLGNA